MGRPAGPPQDPPLLKELLDRGLSRVRANLAVQVGTLRFEIPLTRAQLATRAGLNPRQVEEIETGKRDPSFTTVVRIANALQIRALDELLGPMPLEVTRSEPDV
jgi:putative transcriptional regulator